MSFAVSFHIWSLLWSLVFGGFDDEHGTAGDQGMITASPSTINSPDDIVTVHFYNISFTDSSDWVGLFNYSLTPYCTVVPPIKYRLVGNQTDGPGYMQFRLINRRTDYFFAYIQEKGPYRDVQAISKKVEYNDKYSPMHIHIAAISPDSSDYTWNLFKTNMESNTNIFESNIIQIMWIQKNINKPQIKYGLNKNSLTNSIDALYFDEYQRSDMCDQWRGQPAGGAGYFEPGILTYVYLTDLTPDTIYYYQVGDSKHGWSPTYSFKSPPKFGQMPQKGSSKNTTKTENNGLITEKIGTQEEEKTVTTQNEKNVQIQKLKDETPKLKFVAFGDMGQTPIDGSRQHSWDWNNHGELYSINVSHLIANNYVQGPSETSDFVLHIGDISYAVGYLFEWDNFFWQNKDIMNKVAYFVGIGNHEFGNTVEWAPVDLSEAYSSLDSQGECGVPYNYYFPYASIDPFVSYDNREPWYTIDYGIVRTIVMSSEHDYSNGSTQYNYVYNQIISTDRKLFPWIIIAIHRPVYVNSNWSGDLKTASYMQSIYESMWNQHKVGLGLYGHHHAYARTCPIVTNGTCVEQGKGMVHMVIGMAGYKLSGQQEPPYSWFEVVDNQHYGFVHFTVENETHLYGKYIDALENQILDEFYIVNTYQM